MVDICVPITASKDDVIIAVAHNHDTLLVITKERASLRAASTRAALAHFRERGLDPTIAEVTQTMWEAQKSANTVE